MAQGGGFDEADEIAAMPRRLCATRIAQSEHSPIAKRISALSPPPLYSVGVMPSTWFGFVVEDTGSDKGQAITLMNRLPGPALPIASVTAVGESNGTFNYRRMRLKTV